MHVQITVEKQLESYNKTHSEIKFLYDLKYLGVYTVQQLIEMTNDWNARPFEEFYTTIPKQQVQFPSITVCPSGK